MSTRTKVRSPRWRTVSIASRVVPGCSETITRSSPSSAFSRLDLPTFGRPEDRDADRALLDLLRAGAGKHRHDRVEQVAAAVAVYRRDGDRVAEAEPVELEREHVLARVVDLVREEEHGLVGAAEDRGQLLVAGHHAGPRVGDEEDEVGFGDRGLRLLGDRARQRRRVGDVDAAGVDQQEAVPVPLADELFAVTGDAGCLVHDGGAALREPVDERRLADVREADDRHGSE